MSKNLKWIIGPIFIVLIILFFVLYLKDIDYATFSKVELSWQPLILATIISLGFRYWGVFIWRIVLRALGSTKLPDFTTLSSVYARAWMARYIPGTVAWVGGKIYMANKYGISKSRLAVSSLVEAGAQIIATMAIALIILGLDPRLDVISWQLKVAMILIGIGITLALYPPLFNALVRYGYKLVRRKEAYDELSVNGKAVYQSFALYIAGAFLSGSSYYFLATAISPDVTPDMYWFVVGTLSLSGALGMATPLVPSGLGVRDGVQLVLLSVIMPKEIALVITIASRLWSAVVDVLFYLSAETVARLKKS